MSAAILLTPLAVLVAVVGRLATRGLPPGTATRVLAVVYGVALTVALTVALGSQGSDVLGAVCLALASALAWRLPDRMRVWAADLGEVVLLGAALSVLAGLLDATAWVLIACAGWAGLGAVLGLRHVDAAGRTTLAIAAGGVLLGIAIALRAPTVVAFGPFVAALSIVAALVRISPIQLGELGPRLGWALLGATASTVVTAAALSAWSVESLAAPAVLGAVLVDVARAPRRRATGKRVPVVAAASSELPAAVRKTLVVIERLTDPLAAQTQVVQALDEMFPGGRFQVLASPTAPRGLLATRKQIGNALLDEVCRAGVLLRDDADDLPAAAARELSALGGTLLLPVACGDIVYGALLVHRDDPDDALVTHARRFADLLGHKLETHRLYGELEQRQRLATVGTFSAALIHDLKGPLSAVRMNLQLIESAARQDAPDRESVDEAMMALDRVFAGLTETLDFTRPLALDVGTLDPAELAARTVDEARHQARALSVELELTAQDGIPEIRGDEVRLRRVLDNLVRNAIEVAPEGSTVSVAVTREQDGVQLSVCDRGRGIEPQVRETLFEPFVTTKDRGVGLGLAIAHKVVERHKGRIDVDDHPGGGTCMRVWLPA